MAYELVQKPSFYNDLWSLPRHVQQRIGTAVAAVARDPFRADGKVKKIFKHLYSNVYRYKLHGDYRLVYAVGANCVSLMAVGHRKDIYKRFNLDPSKTPFLTSVPGNAEPVPIATTVYDPVPDRKDLPEGVDTATDEYTATVDDDEGTDEAQVVNLLKGLLTLWNVPEEYHEAVLTCRDPEELVESDIPDGIKETVLHIHQPPTVTQIVEQPTMDLAHPEDLNRYLEGQLRRFLLKLDPDQERVAARSLRGPTLVKGGPGTGKSLVALYRIRNILDEGPQLGLFQTPKPRILFLTFTRSLIAVCEELLTELLGEVPHNVDIMNLDRKVRELVVGAGDSFRPVEREVKEEYLRMSLEHLEANPSEAGSERVLRSLLNLPDDFLLDEFDWVIEGRALQDVASYLLEDRTGRGIPLDRELRRGVWTLHQIYLNLLRADGYGTWDIYRQRAAEIARSFRVSKQWEKLYDVVIVDEAQDLTPAGLRVCVELCKTPQGIYLTADASQSIYSRGFSWQRVHEELNVRGRTTILKRNYRSTKQIADAAVQLLRDHGGGDGEALATVPVRSGPLPVLYGYRSTDEELLAIKEFLLSAARETRLPVAGGVVLVRRNKIAEEIADGLSRLGIQARHVRGDEVNLHPSYVRVMTMHTAKGLEFPFVVVARVSGSVFPQLTRILTEEEREDRIADERRLFFVALTRAMRRLLVTYDENDPSQFIDELDRDLWNDGWRLSGSCERMGENSQAL